MKKKQLDFFSVLFLLLKKGVSLFNIHQHEVISCSYNTMEIVNFQLFWNGSVIEIL